MLESMFIGLSGMTAYSDGLRQVSNNITNLNSSGYKGSSLIFRDLFGYGGGIGYNNQSGGGNGVSLALTPLDFSQGELRQSDRSLDLAVDGEGFLVLERDGDYFYARTGNFEVDRDGYIVLIGTDYRLTSLDGAGRATAINIAPERTNAPQATTRIEFADNLSSTSTEFTVADVQVFNADGDADNWTIEFTRAETDPAGEWSVTVTGQNGEEIGEETLKFLNGVVDPTTRELTFQDQEGGRNVILDFSNNVTSFSSGELSTLRAADVDGFGIGDITQIGVNDEGLMEIQYSNEQTKDLGAVTLADFRDQQSLEQRSGGIFATSDTRGVNYFSSESERVGRVLSSRTEASNIELSSEFGDLILVQRGYQAASQVVSVSNEMLQQLFALRGQG